MPFYEKIRKKYDMDRGMKIYIVTFIAGIIIGTLVSNYLYSNSINDISAHFNYLIEKIKNVNINKTEYLKYVFNTRLKEMLLVLLFSITMICRFYNCIYCLYLGYLTSTIICMFSMSNGFEGLILYIISIFPHYIIYIFTVYLVVTKSEYINRIMFGNRNISQTIRPIIVLILQLCVLCSLQSLVEVYINLEIITKFLQNI